MTSVAVNLATTLAAAKDHETILLDFDLIFGSVDAVLDIVPDNTLYTRAPELRTARSDAAQAVDDPACLGTLRPAPPHGDRRGRQDRSRDPAAGCSGLLKAAFGTVVIDTSKGLQSSDFVAFEMSDVILVVVQLDLTCLRNTARLIGLFQQFDGLADRVKLVVNRTGLERLGDQPQARPRRP